MTGIKALDERAAELAAQLAEVPSVAVAKQLLYASRMELLGEQLNREREAIVALAATEDFRVRLEAFVSRRA